MKNCTHCIVFLTVASISFSLFENQCNLKPSCLKRRGSSYILPSANITCFKSQSCRILERNSSCNAQLQGDIYAIALKNAVIHHNNEGLWTQLILRSSHHRDLIPQGNQAMFVVRVYFNQDSHCYTFIVPASFIKDSFVLPCIQVSTELEKSLKLLLTIYYKASARERAELIYLQATEYPLNSISAKETIKSKQLQIKYYFDDLSFHLTINSKCSFKVYKVSVNAFDEKKLCGTSGVPICNATSTLTNIKPFPTHQFSLACNQSLFKPCQLYCVSTTAFNPHRSCSSVYPRMSSEITYFQRAAEEMDRFSPASTFCKNWQATAPILIHSKEPAITVVFSPFEIYKNCFPCYEVYLYKLFSLNCDPHYGIRIRYEIATLRDERGEATFSNLSEGNFCALIEPCMNSIHEAVAVSSQVVTIVHGTEEVLKFRRYENFPVETIVAAILLLSIAGFGISLRIRRALRHKQKCEEESVDKYELENLKHPMYRKPVQSGSDRASEIIPLAFPKTRVYVFDSWNDTARQKLLKDFVDFLQTCAELEVVDDLLHRFLADPNHWTIEIFDYECSKMGDSGDSNKKFVFIHSGRYKPDANCNKGKAFVSALDSLLMDQKKSQRDYCHVFVVHLEQPQCRDGTEELVSLKRFDIQNNQLIDLCTQLGYPSAQREKLQRHLENHKIYGSCKKNNSQKSMPPKTGCRGSLVGRVTV